jgi:superfamily II DNA or RNA helicase
MAGGRLVTVDSVAEVITSRRYRYASEDELQRGIEEAFLAAAVPHHREVNLGAAGRIDFLVGRVGVEVKIAGEVGDVHRQLVRYAARPEVHDLLLVTSRRSHTRIPSVVAGKQLRVVVVESATGASASQSPAFTVANPGVLKWHDSGAWLIGCAPHVAMRVKRMFPRANQARTGVIAISDTPEVARDLEWLLERYPLALDEASRTRLAARAGEHRDTEDTMLRILAGQHLTDLRDPARPPRTYQLTAADLAFANRRLLLADDVGLGKTFSSMLLFRSPETLPALVVTLAHLPGQWLRELRLSFPWLTGHVVTRGAPYDVAADVLIMNYHKLSGWADHLAGRVNTVIFDEIQELRHQGTRKYESAGMIADKATWRMGLSATPVYNYGGEIHSIMSILDQDALGTRTEFLREWGAGDYSGKGKVSNPAALGGYLRDSGLMLRRTRVDVHRELPDPVRITHDVPSDPRAYDAIAGDLQAMAQLILDPAGDRTEKWKVAGDLDWKLRQATGIAKAPYVAEFVRLLLESEDKVVLFGWHRAVYATWAELLAPFDPVFYTGTESPTQKQAAADAFVNGTSRVLIMSLRSGAGLDGLQTAASVLVFGELDWSPAMHDQCIGRLARDGQEATVAAYFLVTDTGSDPVVADVLDLKRQQAEPIRDPDAPLLTTNDASADRIKLLAADVLKRAGGTDH